MKLKLLTLFLLSFIFQNYAKAQNPNLTFTVFYHGGIDSITDLVNAGDSRMFVVQQSGYIWVLDAAGNQYPKPFLDVSDEVGTMGNEEGLLGLAFSPNYKNDGYFFVHYTDVNQAVHIARFQVSATNADSAVKSSETTVIRIYHPYQNHNGGNIAFGPDGYLYDGIGDGGSAGDPGNRAQNTDSLLGKLLRLDVSSLPYKIPPTNPFANNSKGRPEIWAYGLRNPFCWSFDKFTADLWIGDVGQDLYEEVDFQPAGDTGGINYGWHCYEGDSPYNTSTCTGVADYTFPVYAYEHSVYEGCCIIGGYVYRGAQYKSLFGKYLFTDLCSGLFRSIVNNSGTFNETDLNAFQNGGSTKFGQDIYGELYVAERDSYIYKIGDTACAPVAFISFSDTLRIDTNGFITALYGQGLIYQWKLNNTVIGTGDTIKTASSGVYTVTVSNGRCSSSASVVVELATGINTPRIFKNLQLVPNPNNGTFNLNLVLSTSSASVITIYDVLGRTVLTKNVLFNSGKNTLPISGGNLLPGVYFLKLSSQQGEMVVKFVVTE